MLASDRRGWVRKGCQGGWESWRVRAVPPSPGKATMGGVHCGTWWDWAGTTVRSLGGSEGVGTAAIGHGRASRYGDRPREGLAGAADG